MDINKTFFVETSPDGITRIYSVNKRFFTGKPNSGGLMAQFNANETTQKNGRITQLKNDGWLPLSLEDIKKTSVNEIGVVTAYPFKYRKGYTTINKIEELARDKGIIWEREDHFLNPFSTLKDYTDFINSLENSKTCDAKSFKRQLAAFADRLLDIGALEAIENFFKGIKFVPDPRRFNKTIKELWRYYENHLNECARLVLNEHVMLPGDKFNIDYVMIKLQDIKSLQSLISNQAYEKWLVNNAKKP